MFVQISESQVGRALRTGRWKYGVHAPELDANRDMSAARYREEYLYDLHSDPYELRNLMGWESHLKVAEMMRGRLLRRMVQAGEAAPEIIAAPPVRSGQRRVEDFELAQ